MLIAIRMRPSSTHPDTGGEYAGAPVVRVTAGRAPRIGRRLPLLCAMSTHTRTNSSQRPASPSQTCDCPIPSRPIRPASPNSPPRRASASFPAGRSRVAATYVKLAFLPPTVSGPPLHDRSDIMSSHPPSTSIRRANSRRTRIRKFRKALAATRSLAAERPGPAEIRGPVTADSRMQMAAMTGQIGLGI